MHEELSAVPNIGHVHGRYFMQAIRLAMRDSQVRTGLALVNHMMEPPTALFKPMIAAKVLLLVVQDAFAKVRKGLQPQHVQGAQV